jgi:predicted dienelactone hydrolase
VAHRREPLPLDLWQPSRGAADTAERPWLLLMPGLGGDADHLGWLAGALARRGWAVVVLQHPGSDGAAVRSTLAGRRPPPGAETLTARLADAEAVLAARRDGQLPLPGRGVVLMGHSLGAVTALMAAGLAPEDGLEQRCGGDAEHLPLSNPSRLLQCQLPPERLPRVPGPPPDLRAVVLLNGFGSLYWPRRALSPLGVPVLMVGGSLDLITPPLDEQLALFLPQGDPRSRLVMVEGGSHFSPVRMSDPEEALFRIGSDLVGVSPENVQQMLLSVTGTFLEGLDRPLPLAPQRLQEGGVVVHVLDPRTARSWRAGLGG